MPDPYTNRELDEKFSNLSTLIREKHDDTMIKLGEVIVQTSKTNGSVANLKLWRAYMTGAIGVILFMLTAIVIPVMITYLGQYAQTHTIITK